MKTECLPVDHDRYGIRFPGFGQEILGLPGITTGFWFLLKLSDYPLRRALCRVLLGNFSLLLIIPHRRLKATKKAYAGF